MPSYQEYQEQIAKLKELADKARRDEISEAKKRVQSLMSEYGLSITDLLEQKQPSKKRAAVDAKYRDTATGQTWSGRGRAPRWLDGKDKEAYRIK